MPVGKNLGSELVSLFDSVIPSESVRLDSLHHIVLQTAAYTAGLVFRELEVAAAQIILVGRCLMEVNTALEAVDKAIATLTA